MVMVVVAMWWFSTDYNIYPAWVEFFVVVLGWVVAKKSLLKNIPTNIFADTGKLSWYIRLQIPWFEIKIFPDDAV
jgi:hypothetical protein